ncbi:MAG: iron-sulfur cluster carrier protein ApbC [Oleiphilaceae bacterium]|nr:iron-sulfur cluster carrier protein ApbC [Oleiphilaceae bacterium]
MAQIDQAELESAIKNYVDPYLNCDLFALDAVEQLDCDGGAVRIKLVLPYACTGIHGALKQLLQVQLELVDGVESVAIEIETRIASSKARDHLDALAGVKNIIAVASGKGGVGKSTSAVNLALALAAEGARVGILDADIYGPSVGMMLGIADGTRPQTKEDKFFVPLEAHGIQAMSMAFLVTEQTPMVWRGPMVSGALMQLLTQSLWDDIDFLIVDLPPGTGDIQLTLSQKIPVTASIVITTPQDIALLDCKKGIEMFRKVDIPVLGVIENMSTHICSNCGHHEALFGEGGGERIAQQYETELLGQMPLHKTIREQTDNGTPTVIAEPDSEVALLYKDIARKVGALLSQQSRNKGPVFPEIIVSND